VVGLVLCAVAAGAAVVFLVSVGLIRGEQVLADEATRQVFLGRIQAVSGLDRVLLAGASALVGMGAVTLLLRRFTGPSVPASRHILAADDRGVILVASPGIASVVEAAVMRTPGVVETEVKVSGSGRAPVRLRVVVLVFGTDELKRIGDEVRAAARTAVERQVGIEVSEVVVDVQVIRPEELERELA